jgi:hypothetical protein
MYDMWMYVCAKCSIEVTNSTYAYVCIYEYIHTNKHTSRRWLLMRQHNTKKHTHLHAHTHTTSHIHTHIHAYIYIYIYIYTHTYIQGVDDWGCDEMPNSKDWIKPYSPGGGDMSMSKCPYMC